MSKIIQNLADLTSLRDRDTIDEAVVRVIIDFIDPLTASLCRLVGDEKNEHWFITADLSDDRKKCNADSTWSSFDSLPSLNDFPLRAKAVNSRQVVIVDGPPFTSIFPIIGKLGSMAVLEVTTEKPLTLEDSRLISCILRMYLNFQDLLDYGERDTLTELLNRKTFDGAFLKATMEQTRGVIQSADDRREVQEGSYWLAMIDIDHFKNVNDNFGHMIGDEVLLLLARLMRGCFRFHDQIYRFGGEEFVVLMRCDGETDAANALERLRGVTEKHDFPQVGCITISIGFTEVKAGDTPGGAFERSDKAVYYAKEHGRNQVFSFESLIASGELIEQVAISGDVELF